VFINLADVFKTLTMDISSDGKTVYVASRDENKLAVVSASDLSLITKVDTDGETHGVAYRD